MSAFSVLTHFRTLNASHFSCITLICTIFLFLFRPSFDTTEIVHGKQKNSWIEDYIQPAIEKNKVDNFEEMLEKTKAQVEKKIAQEKNKVEKNIEKDNDHDPDETETEMEDSESDFDTDVKISKQSEGRTKPVNGKKKIARKAKSTKTKAKSKQKNPEEDLIAAIRNKNGRGNPLASIAARYGVSSMEDDPLDDAKFAKLRSKYSKKK